MDGDIHFLHPVGEGEGEVIASVHPFSLTIRFHCMHTEIKCPPYEFPAGVEGGSSDPCKPAPDFQLSSTTDPSCSLKCRPGYEQEDGTGVSTLQCGKDGKLSGELACTGQHMGTQEVEGDGGIVGEGEGKGRED